jgi:arsenate reductase
MNENKPKVLFLCTGNSARSQMAEGFLRHYAGDKYEVHSAGMDPQGINPLAIQVMAEKGISIDHQTSDSIRKYLGKQYFGIVVTVCDHAEKNCPRVWLDAQDRHIHWGLEDPAAFEGDAEAKLAKFREIRDIIDETIQGYLLENGVYIDGRGILA